MSELRVPLGRRCDGSHEHVWLMNQRAKGAERYPPAFVTAVVWALRHRLRRDRNVPVNALEAGIGPHMDEPDMPLEPLAPEDDTVEDGMESDLPRAWDEHTGTLLDGAKVKESQGVEIGLVDKLGVWVFRPRAECWTETGRPPMGTRKIDHNKGDEEHEDIKCRLVV